MLCPDLAIVDKERALLAKERSEEECEKAVREKERSEEECEKAVREKEKSKEDCEKAVRARKGLEKEVQALNKKNNDLGNKSAYSLFSQF